MTFFKESDLPAYKELNSVLCFPSENLYTFQGPFNKKHLSLIPETDKMDFLKGFVEFLFQRINSKREVMQAINLGNYLDLNNEERFEIIKFIDNFNHKDEEYIAWRKNIYELLSYEVEECLNTRYSQAISSDIFGYFNDPEYPKIITEYYKQYSE